VTFDGPLNLDQVSSVHITSKGLIATGAEGTGAGTIDVGYASNVYFQNTQTFDDATINLSGGVGGYGIHQQDTTGKGATLTLGVNLTVDSSTASYGQGYTGIFGGTYARDAIVNDGVIDVSTRDGRFSIDARTFTNAGTIDIGGGAVVIFSDRLTTSQLGMVDVVTYGGYLDFAGTLNNNGATLALAAGEGVEGVINGGTIAGTIGQNGLTLTGVAVEGAVVGAVTIAGGLTMTGAGGTGAGVIDGRAITFRNTQAVDGAMIDLEGLITQEDTTRKGATLTLGSDVTIALIGNAGIYGGAYAGDAIVNDGVIDVSAHQLTIAALTFTNPGAIDLANGGEVTFKDDLTTAQLGKIEVGAGGGALDFAGTLENTGATLTVAAGEVLEGLINGGTIVGTITGPTDQGRDDLTIAGGLEMAGSGGTGRGTIDVSDSLTPIFFQDTETIDNAVINLTGEATIVQRDTTGKGAILTLGGNLTIEQLSTGGAGGSGLFGGAYAGDAIVNDG
jgi:hypothetical protein